MPVHANLKFIIRDLFRLSDGAVVFALEGIAQGMRWEKRAAAIRHNGTVAQKIRIGGERVMSRQKDNLDKFAVDTWDNVQLTNEQVRSGDWTLELLDE